MYAVQLIGLFYIWITCAMSTAVCDENMDTLGSSWLLLQTSAVTCIITCAFIGLRLVVGAVRSRYSCVDVVVVGAGPVGLMSALIAARNRHASKVVVYEQRLRSVLLNQYHQVSKRCLKC